MKMEKLAFLLCVGVLGCGPEKVSFDGDETQHATWLDASETLLATGEGAVRLETPTNHYGIQGYITIPSDVFVANDGSYIAFYLGLGNQCEGGISYTPATGWKKFLNCGANSSNVSNPLTTQPTAGTSIHLKLVNNLNNTASLYVNGALAYTVPVGNGTLTSPTKVKMVHSTQDHQDKNKYTNASFAEVTVKNQDGTYSAFPSTVTPSYPWGVGDYVVLRANPLSTTLKPGN